MESCRSVQALQWTGNRDPVASSRQRLGALQALTFRQRYSGQLHGCLANRLV